MRIGINFRDNDFHATLKPFMQLLKNQLIDTPELANALTKERVVEIFNMTAYGMMILFH